MYIYKNKKRVESSRVLSAFVSTKLYKCDTIFLYHFVCCDPALKNKKTTTKTLAVECVAKTFFMFYKLEV